MPSIRSRPASSVARLCLSLVVLSCALAALPTAASAGAPATVTVRVEGFSGHTLLPQTAVTTTTAPVDIDGNPAHDCSGTSAGGALYDALYDPPSGPARGSWGVTYSSSFGEASIDAIDGLDLSASSDVYWALYDNSVYASVGMCEQELSPGDHVVLVESCYQPGPDCTKGTEPDHYLTESQPGATTVPVNTAVTVTIGSTVAGGSGAAEPLPTGVVVSAVPPSGAPVVAATPNAQGVATLAFGTAGTYTIQATAPDAVPSDSYTVCVHNGNDGNCGTTAPPQTTVATSTTSVSTSTSTTATPSAGVQGTSTKAGPAFAAFATGVLNSHVYPSGRGPRTLAGHVTAPGALTAVRLRLTRTDKGRCSSYDGVTERFRASRCGVGHGTFFTVGSEPTFSYLLPHRLGPGRYVFDIEAVDVAGHVSALHHGTSRIVFYVT